MTSAWIEKRKGKKNFNYLVVWRVGKRRESRGFGPFREQAKQFLTAKRQALYGGEKGPWRGEILGEAIERYLKDATTYKAVNTVEHFDRPALKSFSAFLGNIPLESIQKDHILNWKLDLLSHYNNNTARMFMRSARTFFNYLKVPNPIKDVEMPTSVKVARPLTNEEINKALNAKIPAIMRRLVIFGLHTGVRRGEALALDWRHVADNMAEITWHDGKDTKNRFSRRIPLSQEAIESIGTPKPSGRIFEGLTENNVNYYCNIMANHAGIARLRFHDLRHTWATRMARSGQVSIDELMYRGGWRSLTSMRDYLHLFRGKQTSAVDLGFAHLLPIGDTKHK